MSSNRRERQGDDAVFRALADATRRQLLDALRVRPQTTGELVELVPTLSRFGVMDHLAVLVDAGLVTVQRQGRERLNFLNSVPIRRLYERWMRPFAEAEAITLLRLQGHLEAEKGKA